MVGGAIIVGFCLLTLGWTAEIAAFFISDPDAVREYGINEKEDVGIVIYTAEENSHNRAGCPQHLCGRLCHQCRSACRYHLLLCLSLSC